MSEAYDSPTSRRSFLRAAGLAAAGSFLSSAVSTGQIRRRPNILWLIAEDIGPELGCYGYPLVTTPNLDRLASQGARFTNAFTTGPVCSASRSGIAVGMYQTTICAHHHRSHRGDGYTLPEPIKLITEYFRQAGYFTANVTGPKPEIKGAGKTDYNFQAPKPFDGNDWNELKDKQPFYAQVNFSQPHRGGGWSGAREQAQQDGCLIDPAKVPLPPYLPDHPVVRDDWAHYLDAIHLLDVNVGAVLKRLEADGLADNTIVFFVGDNGQCHVRGKQWLYDAGIHVPLIVRWPGQIQPGTVRDDLVSAIDLSATSLRLADIELPAHIQGQVFLGPDATPREYVFAARDRCDETVECIRCVRTKQFKYIRNYRSDLPYMQPNQYKDSSYPARNILRQLQAEGKLTPVQAAWMAPRKPPEELYDMQNDPYEVRNLADSPQHQHILNQLREVHIKWMDETRDPGLIPEPQLAELSAKYGGEYAILQHPDNRELTPRLRRVIELGEQGKACIADLVGAMSDATPPVRYWAATWLGNLGQEAKPAIEVLRQALRDSSAAVRVAAARALCVMDLEAEGLAVLQAELKNENPIVRHHAALALEDIGDKARPALDSLKAATKDSYDSTKRVATRAVGKLGG